MIKTYIYGTPKGFNLYEKDSEAASDFQLFYSTSRRRKRMMVQRMPSGVTRYNYLQYDVTDSGGRPHGFFGMTLQVDGFEFSPDLKTIYAWFEHLFYNKILKETSLFSVLTNEFGAVTGLKYNVSFFAQNSSEVEMVKSVLPNIFAEKGGLPLIQYDDSYGVGAHAEIAGLNPEEDPEIIETAFKKYSWVSLSEKYALLSAGTSTPSVELDYGDLKKQAGTYKDDLLTVATGQEKDPAGKLGEIETGIDVILEKIANYAQGLSPESDEFKSFEDLFNEYNVLRNTVLSLVSRKDPEPDPDPDPDPDPGPEPPQTRRCVRCHKELPLRYFSGLSPICRDCKAKQEAEDARKRNRIVAVAAALVVLIFGAVWLLWPDKKPVPRLVDNVAFEKSLSEKQYENALTLLKSKSDSTSYVEKITEAVSAELDQKAKSGKEGMKGLEELYKSREGILDCCGGTTEKQKWSELITDYTTLASRYLNKSSLTDKQIKEAIKITQKYPGYLQVFDAEIHNKGESKGKRTKDTEVKAPESPKGEKEDYYIMVGNKKYDKSATISIEAKGKKGLKFSCDARYKLVTYLSGEGKITDSYVLERENKSKIIIRHEEGNKPCVIALDHNGKRVLHLTVKPGRKI